MKIKGSRKAIKHAKVMNIDRWKGSPHRAKPPTPIPPQAPDPPFRSRGIAKPGPGGRGWVLVNDQPRPSLVLLNAIATNQKHSTRINTQAHHAGPLGAADFPCLRQLPPPPKRAPAQKGSDVEKDDKHKRKNKENARETKRARKQNSETKHGRQ